MSTRRVGVVGLGPMGGAIARVLIAQGNEVFVWNRTAEVARRLPGATATDSVAALIREVDSIVVSLPGYRITRELLETRECQAALDGKLLVQLSTGGPQQARQQRSWAETHGASFLAGSPLGYPRSLGTDAMTVLYGGSRASFDDWASSLAELAPGQLFVGDDPGAPAALSGPLWHLYYGAYGAFLEAAAYADAAGIDIRDFLRAARGMNRVLLDGMQDSADRISENPYLGRAIERGEQDHDPSAAFRHLRHTPQCTAGQRVSSQARPGLTGRCRPGGRQRARTAACSIRAAVAG
jgi:3-hydroxyisobutyrate dehydrogenase-like beta-hydroxyacid dehydrogenase